MVPSNLTDYFAASSAVAGTLIGLLFVAITLRYEAILGKAAEVHNRAVAAAAFTALVNALSISLWALIPGTDLGYPGLVLAIFSLVSTVRTNVREESLRARLTGLFVLSFLAYTYQLVNSVGLIFDSRATSLIYGIAYTTFAAFASALARSWQLLQPENQSSPVDQAPDNTVQVPEVVAHDNQGFS